MEHVKSTIDWNERAWRRWGKYKPCWICGDGPIALLAWCRELSISLHASVESAEKNKVMIDKCCCGGCCNRQHEIVYMGTRQKHGRRQKTLPRS